MKKLVCDICNKPINTKKELVTFPINLQFLAWLKPAHEDCFNKEYQNKFRSPPIINPVVMIFIGFFMCGMFISGIIRNPQILLFVIPFCVISLGYSAFIYFHFIYRYKN